jgi:hypothetical protein
MHRSTKTLLAGVAIALGTLATRPAALPETGALAQDCFSSVAAVARRATSSLGDIGDRGVAELLELDAMGAPDTLILRSGAGTRKILVETAASSARALGELGSTCIEQLKRTGASEALLDRFEQVLARSQVRIQEMARIQVFRVEQTVARML